MKKIIQMKGAAVFWGLIFVGIIVFAIYNKEDLSLVNSHFKLNIRNVIFFLCILTFLLISFVYSLLWKLEYDDVSFSLKTEGIYNLEYKKITSIVHHKAYGYRHGIDQFTISYNGILSDLGYKKGSQEFVIKNFPHNSKMKEFFSFVHEKNPDIKFRLEKTVLFGPETVEFDYFSKDYKEEKLTKL